MEITYTVDRTIDTFECPWLDQDVPRGAVVFAYHGATYGCITPNGTAVTFTRGGPFRELPTSSLIRNLDAADWIV